MKNRPDYKSGDRVEYRETGYGPWLPGTVDDVYHYEPQDVLFIFPDGDDKPVAVSTVDARRLNALDEIVQALQ